jgi:transformation/transcription domain-associated protein
MYSTEERLIISALLVGVKSVMAMIRTLDGRVPDAEAMSKVIQSMCKVFPLFSGEGEPRLVANIKDVFLEMEPHVFQEVWTTQMDLFMETAVHYKALLVIQQALFSNDATSNSLTAIVLRYLVDRLDIIGEDTPIAALHLRVFRLVFNAVGMNPEHNERMLLPHLGKMLVDIFPLAARTIHSMAYFSLIHNLFRAIGAKTSRFELVYKDSGGDSTHNARPSPASHSSHHRAPEATCICAYQRPRNGPTRFEDPRALYR